MTIVINSPASSASVSGTVAVGFTVQNTYATNGGGSITLSQSSSLSVNTSQFANGLQTITVEGGGQSATRAVIVGNSSSASPDGKTLTPPTTDTIIDNAGGIWSLSAVAGNQKVFLNGALAGFTSQVTLLLFYNGTIWQRNSGNLWWPWSGSAWTGSGVADPRGSSQSPSNTTIPPAATITDAVGGVWTLDVPNNTAYQTFGGTQRFRTNAADTVLFYNGRVYVHNLPSVDNFWYQSNNDTTQAGAAGTDSWTFIGADPRGATPSLTVSNPPQNFSLTSPVSFQGQTNRTSVQIKDGATTLSNVAVVSGAFSAAFSVSNGVHNFVISAVSVTAITRSGSVNAVPSTMGIHFYGTNSHWVQGAAYQGVPLSTQAAHMTSLGIKQTRQDCYNIGDVSAIAAIVIPGEAPIVVMPVLINSGGYNACFTLGQQAAQKLVGVIPVVEFGNEFDNGSGPIGSDGESITNYNQTAFVNYRESLRGLFDGWKSVDTTNRTKIIINPSAGWLHFGFLDGLWNGKEPNGSTGHPVVRGDILCWHWYSDMGDITKPITGGSGTYNVLDKLHQIVANSAMPIMITEIGARPDGFGGDSASEGSIQAYMHSQLSNIVAVAASKNIWGVNWYELYDHAGDPDYGLYFYSGGAAVTQKPRWTTMRDFISAHPMTSH